MSDDAVKDILTFLEEEGVGTYGKLLIRNITREMRDLGQQYVSCYVSSSSIAPYNVDETDTINMVMQVSGGLGEKGESEGFRLAMQVYRLLNLQCDRIINDTLYCGIHNTSSPYESQNGDNTVFSWNVELVRYYGDEPIYEEEII